MGFIRRITLDAKFERMSYAASELIRMVREIRDNEEFERCANIKDAAVSEYPTPMIHLDVSVMNDESSTKPIDDIIAKMRELYKTYKDKDMYCDDINGLEEYPCIVDKTIIYPDGGYEGTNH